MSAERRTLFDVAKRVRAELRERDIALGCWSVRGDSEDTQDCDVAVDLKWSNSIVSIAQVIGDVIEKLGMSSQVTLIGVGPSGGTGELRVKLLVRRAV